MRQVLGVVASFLGGSIDSVPWHLVRYQHTQFVRTQLASTLSPASANKGLAALRGVLKEARRLGLLSAEDHACAVDLEAVRGSRVLRGRALGTGEIRALFAACDPDTNKGARDAAVLALGVGGGLRRSEIVHLDLGSYDPETGALTITGKGNKQRVVYLTNGAAAALEAWLARRGAEPGPLLMSVNKADRIARRRLSADAILVVLRGLGKAANVAKFSPHDCRRTMASAALDAGIDVVVLQAILGHASVTTTAKYDRRGDRAKRRAAELLHVPFIGGAR
jgi:integrase